MISDKIARQAKLPEGKSQHLIWDDKVKGFFLRVTANRSTFGVQIYNKGKDRRVTIGPWPEWTTAEAREKARRLKHSDIPLKRNYTVADAWRRYEKHHLPELSASTADDRRRYFEQRILPAIGNSRLDDVTVADVEDLHRSVTAPYAANRMLEGLARLYSLAQTWEWTNRNPGRGIRRNKEQPRQDFMSANEMARLMEALPFTESGDLIRVLLLTGCRLGEAKSMAWAQIKDGVWTKPATSTKQRREHRIPLSNAVIEIVERQPIRSPLVFTREDGSPVKDIRATWKWVFKRAGIKRVRVHDARHSFAALLASSGASLQIIGKMLGHSTPAMTARYAHISDPALKEAAEIVAKLGK